MKNLTKVKIREYLTMFGVDACEATLLAEYFEINQAADTGNDTLNAICDVTKIAAYMTVGIVTTYTTNVGIAKLFEDAESEAMRKDLTKENTKKEK